MFQKIKTIIKAWVTSFDPTPLEDEVAKIRLERCLACKYMKRSWVPFSIKYCGNCGCPIYKKVYSSIGKEECSQGNWPV